MKNICPLFIILLLGFIGKAQKVFIDQPVRVGNVTVFPTVDDPNAYYYLPNNPRLAKTKEGKPQFSFLFFTEKNRSGVTEQNIEEQIAGGVVHALVEYGLTEEDVANTKAQLKQINSSSVLKGPIVYKSGNLGLISAIADESGGFVKKVVGVGKAPVLEGSKAAIAFMLETKGAKLLWSSFQTETPDISFSFEMEMAGYLTPIKAWVKGNYDQIYESHQMQLAASGSLGVVTFGAEIGATFDKLRKDGKLDVYSEGDDVDMERLIEIGYKKIADAMFEPVGKSYTEMVNNDPNKIESGMTQLTKLADLQSKQYDNIEKAQSLEERNKKLKQKQEQPNAKVSQKSSVNNALIDSPKGDIDVVKPNKGKRNGLLESDMDSGDVLDTKKADLPNSTSGRNINPGNTDEDNDSKNPTFDDGKGGRFELSKSKYEVIISRCDEIVKDPYRFIDPNSDITNTKVRFVDGLNPPFEIELSHYEVVIKDCFALLEKSEDSKPLPRTKVPIKVINTSQKKEDYNNPCDNPNHVDFDFTSGGTRCMDGGRFKIIKSWCMRNIQNYKDENYSSKMSLKVYPNTVKIYDISLDDNDFLQVGRKHFDLIYQSILLLKFLENTDEEIQDEIKLADELEEGLQGNMDGSKLAKLRLRMDYLVQKRNESVSKLNKAEKLPSSLMNNKKINLFQKFIKVWNLLIKKAESNLDRLTNGNFPTLKNGAQKGKGGPSYDSYYEVPEYITAFAESYFPIFNAPTAPFSVFATYRFRQTKLEGNFEINLNKVSADTRFMRFDENIGNLKELCESCFKTIPIDEIEMTKQREVLFILDGSILSNFKKFINSASITMIKEHSNGKNDFKSTKITYTNFKDSGNVNKLVYGWQENDTNPWRDYKYKVNWSFFQGYNVEEEYTSDTDAVTISPPVTLKTVSIEADPDFVLDNNIKYITVNLSYDYGLPDGNGKFRKQRGYVDLDADGQFVSKPIRLRADGILSKQVGIILPNDSENLTYTYKVTTNDGKSYQSVELESNGLLIDGLHEIPTED